MKRWPYKKRRKTRRMPRSEKLQDILDFLRDIEDTKYLVLMMEGKVKEHRNCLGPDGCKCWKGRQ